MRTALRPASLKSGLIILLVLTSTSLVSSRLFANSEPDPCQSIVKSCADAGFVKNTPSTEDEKDLDHACYEPIMQGQVIGGVEVSLETVRKCRGQLQEFLPAPKKASAPHH